MLRQYERVRQEGMRHFGFGIDAMKGIKICSECGEMMCSKFDTCTCGAPLPKENLYEIYLKRHLHCTECGTVVSRETQFCPECGTKLQEPT